MKGVGEAGDHAQAEAGFEQALAIDPHLIEARMHMVFIYLARGEKEKARHAADQLKQEAPNDVGVHFARGVLARLDGAYNKSLRSFDGMGRLKPAERVVGSYNAAALLNYPAPNEEAW